MKCTSCERGMFANLRPQFSIGPATKLDINHVARYYTHMIRSFKCKYTKALSKGNQARRFENIANVARPKLRQLEIADRLEDLSVPPGNHLEVRKGNRSGQYSIRINNQWCICFFWTDAGAEYVEIVDYY